MGNHGIHKPAPLGEGLHVDVFCLLVDDLPAVYGQRDIGYTAELVLVLGNQDVILNLVAFQLGVRVASDNQVQPWCRLSNLDIVRIAEVREQDGDIALLAEPFVLGDYFLGRLEMDATDVVWVRAGNAFGTQLDGPYDTNLQALHVEHLTGYGLDVRRVVREDVRTDIPE